MPRHWHEEVEILRVLEGEFPIDIDDERFVLKAHDAVYIASGRLHGGTPLGCVYECVVFDMRLILGGAGGACKQSLSEIMHRRVDVTPFLPADSELVKRVIEPMFECLAQDCEGVALITTGCLYQLMGEVYRRHCFTLREDDTDHETRNVLRLKRVFELIESEYRSPPTLDRLSAVVGMTPKYFCRFFKQATRMTPMDYVSRYRIEMACYEMAATDKNVTEIAMDMGYANLNYFIRCFKKHKGVTPRQYQRSIHPHA